MLSSDLAERRVALRSVVKEHGAGIAGDAAVLVVACLEAVAGRLELCVRSCKGRGVGTPVGGGRLELRHRLAVVRGGVVTDYDRQYRYWLNITLKDDTGLAIATVRRKDYEKMGKEILEAVPIGAVLLVRGRMGGNGIRMLQIEKWKVIENE